LKKWFLILAAIIGLFFIERFSFEAQRKKPKSDLLFFPSGKFIKGIASGYDNIFSDFLYIRGAVYYGKHKFTDNSFPYLYHIFDVVTTLDRRFVRAYTVGAFLLYDDARSFSQSMELLDKGIYSNPDEWWIPFVKAFILYLKKDYKKAAKWFYISSLNEKDSDFSLKFQTWCLEKSHGLEMTIEFWQNLYNKSKSQWMKEKAIKGIAKVIAGQIQKFTKDKGRLPVSIVELKKNGYLPYIPSLDNKPFRIKGNEVIW